MTVGLHISDAAKDLTAMSVHRAGATKTITDGFVRRAGGLKQFFSVLKVTLSSYSVLGRSNSAAVVTVYSAPVTATVTGAIGTANHVWTRTAPDGHAWTINSPNDPTTTFSTDADQGESWDATFIDTVTDQAGQVLASDPVAVNNSNIYYGGGYGGPGPGPYP